MKRVFLFALWIFWMGFIFYLSSIPDLKSELPSWQDFIFRKIAHIAEYAILWILTERVFMVGVAPARPMNQWQHMKKIRAGFKKGRIYATPTKYIFLFTILYAVSDEIHQSFVPLRHFALTDIFIDTFGMVLGYITRKKFL